MVELIFGGPNISSKKCPTFTSMHLASKAKKGLSFAFEAFKA